LDIDLDSVIKKQKEKEYETQAHTQDWYGAPNRKRPHNYNKPDVQEVNIEEKESGSAGVISLNARNNNIRNNKRQKTGEEPEVEGEGEGDATQGYPGYKGKKGQYFDPYMGMGGYGFPPQMFMDPYMMYGGYGGYGKPPVKPKKFKNKSLIVKKDGKPLAPSSTPIDK
jgi:hypothetical protein